MAEVIKGDFMSHEDTEITVEPYDDGMALLTVETPETETLAPVTLTREKALELARQLTEAVQEQPEELTWTRQ